MASGEQRQAGDDALARPVPGEGSIRNDHATVPSQQPLLQAEMLALKANPHRSATGTVVQATLDPGKGTVATILVQKGTLRVGENFICGKYSGRVKALYDERGKNVKEAGPSILVQILGFEGVPSPGTTSWSPWTTARSGSA